MIIDFAVSADNRVKMKESEKVAKYLDLTREPEKLSNIKMVVISRLGKVPKGQERDWVNEKSEE